MLLSSEVQIWNMNKYLKMTFFFMYSDRILGTCNWNYFMLSSFNICPLFIIIYLFFVWYLCVHGICDPHCSSVSCSRSTATTKNTVDGWMNISGKCPLFHFLLAFRFLSKNKLSKSILKTYCASYHAGNVSIIGCIHIVAIETTNFQVEGNEHFQEEFSSRN